MAARPNGSAARCISDHNLAAGYGNEGPGHVASQIRGEEDVGARQLCWLPGRPMRVFSPNLAAFSAGIVEGIRGVQIGPGATAFTRIPFSASISARPAVKFKIAPFVDAYVRGHAPDRGASLCYDHPAATDRTARNGGGSRHRRHKPAIDEVGPKIYRDFLPDALASGRYVAAPAPKVVGRGMEAFQQAIDAQRAGVSGYKLVVDLS